MENKLPPEDDEPLGEHVKPTTSMFESLFGMLRETPDHYPSDVETTVVD